MRPVPGREAERGSRLHESIYQLRVCTHNMYITPQSFSRLLQSHASPSNPRPATAAVATMNVTTFIHMVFCLLDMTLAAPRSQTSNSNIKSIQICASADCTFYLVFLAHDRPEDTAS